jgi:hypothetical protein
LRSGRGNTLSCSAIAGVCGEQGEREEKIILNKFQESWKKEDFGRRKSVQGKKNRKLSGVAEPIEQ